MIYGDCPCIGRFLSRSNGSITVTLLLIKEALNTTLTSLTQGKEAICRTYEF